MSGSQGAVGAGLIFQSYGKYQANQDQAEAERVNASFYREQASFAEATGKRQRMIFDRESQVLYGDQLSAFAKAGVDTASSSLFLAKSMLFRQQESDAIKVESDFNVRLATLRARQAEQTADSLESPESTALTIGSGAIGLGSIL